jgi:hypothetical protein
MANSQTSFWKTLLGSLAGIAALITAVGGVYLGLNRNQSPPSTPDFQGQWTFKWHSEISGQTLKGTLTLEPDGETGIKGRIETFTGEWNNISANLTGSLKDDELIFCRDTGYSDVTQCFKLARISKNKFTGTFENKNLTNSVGLSDHGLFDMNR